MTDQRIYGIDVSYAQGEVDWAAVEQSDTISFVYARATEGLSIVDAQFARNALVLPTRPRILWGAYHLFRFPDDPFAQAAFFLATAASALRPGNLVPFIDCEDESAPGPSPSENVKSLAQFAGIIERSIGHRPIIYCSPYWWDEAMGGSDGFAGHPLFVADYGVAQPMLPDGWAKEVLWQYDDAGTVPGITGNVDLDVLVGVDLSAITS